MRRKSTLFASGILFFVWLWMGGTSVAQGEANTWYFGHNAGLDFNGGAPVPLTNGQVFIDEGCGTISDPGGNLLFYTDGITVWNKNHLQMPNGAGLMGNSSSAQSGLIVQRPGSTTIYYIFTATDQANPGGIRYTEVDMALNGGLGDVTANKNILLINPSCEKITGIRHCNNKDVWVVTHDWGSNSFRTYLVTSAGINMTPVVSSAGLVIAGGAFNMNAIGCIKGSPDGKKLASSIQEDNRFELFDFDNSTGIVSNPLLFPVIAGTTYAYGVEFSPDGSRLYFSCPTPGHIYQYDLCAGSPAAIINSGVLVGASSNFIGALQLGPDGKIYLAQWMTPFLGVINNPNTLGIGCNYANSVSLAGQNSMVGLPNFVPYYFDRSFLASDTCLIGTFTAPTYSITSCSGSANGFTSVSWNFGDPSSGANNTSIVTSPTHTFTAAGTYTVSLILNYSCGPDTLQQTISVTSCVFSAGVSSTNVSCNAQCTGTATANPVSGVPPYTYSWSNSQTTQTITGLCAGSYTVTITDSASASVTATVSITEPPALAASTTATSAACGNNGSASVNAGGGTPGYTYSWSSTPAQTAQTATGLGAGNYTATVTDANGCTLTQTVTVASSNVLTVATTSTQTGCAVNNGTATATPGNGTAPYTYLWSNGQTTSTATGLGSANYTVAVTDASGCTQTQTVSITQTPGVPAVVTAVPVSIMAGGSTTLTASGGGNYSWSNGASDATIVVAPAGTTEYCVMVTDTNNCVDSACVTITVGVEPVDCSGERVYLPNAFSPNHDTENDVLRIYYRDASCIKTFRLTIYDRWGEKMYETEDPAFTWDGRYRDKELSTAVFTYFMKAELITGDETSMKGNISLVR